jgi:glyceraldehyde 3-phosphate dehydrogenase
MALLSLCSEQINPWKKHPAEYTVECTGIFPIIDKCPGHLKVVAKKVIMSAPNADVPIFVVGVSLGAYGTSVDTVSNVCYIKNGLAALEIVESLETTVHGITTIQKTVAEPFGKLWHCGRVATQNIIAAATGAANAVTKVMPSLTGKMTGMVLSVPVSNVFVVDLTCILGKANMS